MRGGRGGGGGVTSRTYEERRKGRRSSVSSQNCGHLPETPEEPCTKETGNAVSTLEERGLDRPQTAQPITPADEQVEIIKVYLESRRPGAERHRESVKMLTDEVSQIQEVRYCLKTLRAQMAARQNQNSNHSKYPANGYRDIVSNQLPIPNGKPAQHDSEDLVNDNQDESVKLREATRRLHVQLKEAEKRHQEERDKLQAENSTLQRHLEERTERLQQAQGLSEERVGQLEELKRLLGGMQVESTGLKEKMAAGEMELWQLRARTEQDREGEQRSEVLEKELAMLKEKIHHLDDMLKSQQRKVRHMIEQLQNSRTVIQERDRVIRDLEEKVAFLEAENREMQHHMEYFSGEEEPPLMTPSEKQPQIVYSKPLMPSTHHNQKSLPFIKVIEIKS